MGKYYIYQNILITDGTNSCQTDTSARREELAPPEGRTIFTIMENICICPHVCLVGRLAQQGNGKGLPEVEGKGVLQDLIPDVEQLVFPKVPVEG